MSSADGRAGERHLAFETVHASVGATYFVAVLLFTMCVQQPVYAGLSLTGALAFSCCAHGWRATARGLRWQLPLALLVALINPLFSASGSTVLFTLGPRAIYLESLLFGACMGALLVATLLWFDGAAQVLTGDRVMSLLAGRMPVVALMVSMTMQLVGQLVRRGRAVRAVRRACSASGDAAASVTARAGHASTILLSWALEDSLERADAMRARAWGARRRRSAYLLETMGDRDVAALLLLGCLILANALLAGVAASQWHFYPVMPGLRAWWGYAPYAALVLLPTVVTALDRLGWRRAERKEPARGRQ